MKLYDEHFFMTKKNKKIRFKILCFIQKTVTKDSVPQSNSDCKCSHKLHLMY